MSEKFDAVGMIAQAAGLRRKQAEEIWDEVKGNQRKLSECQVPHNFEPVTEEDGRLPREARCSKCGGTLDMTQARWYQKGLEHGRE